MPYGDSFSSVQAAADQQAALREREGEASSEMMLRAAQLQMQREQQHLQYGLQQRQLDISEMSAKAQLQNAQTNEQYRRDYIDWRNKQVDADTALKSKAIDAQTAAFNAAHNPHALQATGQTLANNYSEANDELGSAADALGRVNQQISQFESKPGVANGYLSFDRKTGTFAPGPNAQSDPEGFAQTASDWTQQYQGLLAQQQSLSQHVAATKQNVDVLRNEAAKAGFVIDHNDGSLVHQATGLRFSPTEDEDLAQYGNAVTGWTPASETGSAGGAAQGAGPTSTGNVGTTDYEEMRGSGHPLMPVVAGKVDSGLWSKNQGDMFLSRADALKEAVDAGQINQEQASQMLMQDPFGTAAISSGAADSGWSPPAGQPEQYSSGRAGVPQQ